MVTKKQAVPSSILPLAAVRFFSIFNLCTFGVLTLMACTPGRDYFDVTFQMMTFSILFMLVFLVLVIPSGRMADRIPKRYGIIISLFMETAVIGVGGLLLASGMCRSTGVILMALLFSAIAFLHPSFYGILPELYQEEDLSRINGNLNFWMFTGIPAGIGFGFLLTACTHFHWVAPGVPAVSCFLLSLLCLLTAFKIRFTYNLPGKNPHIAGTLRQGFRELFRTRSILMASLGYNLIFAFCSALQFILLIMGRERFGANGWSTVALFQLMPLIGFSIGSFFAGRISRRKIELGLIPFGTLGMAAGFILSSYLPGESATFMLEIPLMAPVAVQYFPIAMLWLLIGGIGTGLLLVPLRSYCQLRYRVMSRGAAIALNQACLTFFIALFILITLGLQLPVIRNNFIVPDFVKVIADAMPSVSGSAVLAGFSIFALFMTSLTMCILPDFTLRFVIITLGSTIYQVRARGGENIPAHGPALLVSNHVSFIDSVLISACTSRRVRFLMEEDYLNYPLLRVLAKLTAFITVPSPRRGHHAMNDMLRKVQQALRKGDVICTFPEGRVTSNSILREFKGGYSRMLPPDMDVPLIPICISDMWGSRFSHTARTVKHAIPLRLRHHAAVTIGAPVPHDITPFELRQRIALLGTETAMVKTRPGELPLHAILAHRAKSHPFRKLMRDADGKTYTNFTTFLGAVLLSRELRQILSPGKEYVGVLLPNCSASALSVLAVLYADKVPCPLNFTTPQDVFEKTLAKAEINHIITSRKFLSKIRIAPKEENCIFVEDIVRKISPIKKIRMMLAALFTPASELMNMISPLTRENVDNEAAVLFSSGSTGDPKGVCLTHHNVGSDAHSLAGLIAFDAEKDAFLGNLPLFHSFGLCVCFWIPIATGCRVTYLPNPLDGEGVGKTIVRDHLSLIFATPSFLQTYMRKCKPEQFDNVRLMVTGAERLRSDIAAKFKEMTGGRLEITEGYGCTELSPVVSVNVPDNITDLGRIAGKTGSIGPAISDISVKVVDPITYKELPPESEGLLFVRGPIVMNGYLNDKDKTDKVMIDGYYNTGDIVTMDKSGHISICGRLSRFSKIAGEMVPHEMVESIINELCGLEKRVVAVGSIPDKKKGEALAVLYVKDMPMTPDEIVAELRERSISNLWIPKAVNFYPVDSLPLLGSGKLDLMKLRAELEKIVASLPCD